MDSYQSNFTIIYIVTSLTSCSLSDYVVLTEFTIAALEDSGWYKANYTALYEIDQPPLRWGKGELF